MNGRQPGMDYVHGSLPAQERDGKRLCKRNAQRKTRHRRTGGGFVMQALALSPD